MWPRASCPQTRSRCAAAPSAAAATHKLVKFDSALSSLAELLVGSAPYWQSGYPPGHWQLGQKQVCCAALPPPAASPRSPRLLSPRRRSWTPAAWGSSSSWRRSAGAPPAPTSSWASAVSGAAPAPDLAPAPAPAHLPDYLLPASVSLHLLPCPDTDSIPSDRPRPPTLCAASGPLPSALSPLQASTAATPSRSSLWRGLWTTCPAPRCACPSRAWRRRRPPSSRARPTATTTTARCVRVCVCVDANV